MNSENRENISTFFPTVIQTSEIANAESLNRDLMAEIGRLRETTPNSVPESWSCSLYTTIQSASGLHENPAFAELRDNIMSEATKFANTLAFDIANHPLKITTCWVNIYGPKDAQEIHNHANAVFSGVYYVQAPEGSAGILFHSPMSDVMLEPPYTEINSFNNLALGAQARPGRMIMFRSWLRHSVRPHRLDAERVSIAFNLSM